MLSRFSFHLLFLFDFSFILQNQGLYAAPGVDGVRRGRVRQRRAAYAPAGSQLEPNQHVEAIAIFCPYACGANYVCNYLTGFLTCSVEIGTIYIFVWSGAPTDPTPKRIRRIRTWFHVSSHSTMPGWMEVCIFHSIFHGF